MALSPSLYLAQVMHKRLFPKENAFHYSVYYVALPLARLESAFGGRWFALDRFGLFSFYRKDHADRSGRDLLAWAKHTLRQNGIDYAGDDILLVCMPRILGYVFNPVSFWLCRNVDGGLRAVIAEVNNTFGETHTYLCAGADGAAITANDWMNTEKLFHVSPFLKRTGSYRFRFDWKPESLRVWIDYYDESGQKQLITSLVGQFQPLGRAALLRAFLAIPMVTIKTIVLIHWQAIRLLAKKIRYIKKPPQLPVRISVTENITKNS